MKSKYLIRVDDACPTMDREKWSLFEQIFDDLGIRPIVAVIPDNKDPKQMISEDDGSFWDVVGRWKKKGWEIALHGYDHVYVTHEGGLVPLNKKSEFAGLPLHTQEEKIKAGIEIFRQHGITPRVWVAPSHTFDMNTLSALKEHSPIRVISDGLSYRPFQRYGFAWLPLQLWKVKPRAAGLYTVCYHPSAMTLETIKHEEERLRSVSKHIITTDDALNLTANEYCTTDRIYEHCFLIKTRLFTVLSRIKHFNLNSVAICSANFPTIL